MTIVFVLVALLVLAVLVTANWYGGAGCSATRPAARASPAARARSLIAGGWTLAIAALVAERAGAPFWLQQTLAWPGFLWLALSIYLLLAVVAGEVVRPLLRRFLERRDRPGGPPSTADRYTPGARTAGPHVPRRRPPCSASGRNRRPPCRELIHGGDPQALGAHARAARPAAPAAQRRLRPQPHPRRPRPRRPGAPAAGTRRRSTPAHRPSRRLFVSRVVAGAAAAAAVGTVGYGTYGVAARAEGQAGHRAAGQTAARGARLPDRRGQRHPPRPGPRPRLRPDGSSTRSTRTQPDLIAVVGDLVDGSVEDLGPAAAPLRAAEGPARRLLRHRQPRVLLRRRAVGRGGPRAGPPPAGERPHANCPYFDLAGVNDIAGEERGPGPRLRPGPRRPGHRTRVVLLAHQPVQIHDAVEHGVDLQLSGHTHGGQLWPGNLIAAAANPTLAGLERYGDTQLYVTPRRGRLGPADPGRRTVGHHGDRTGVEAGLTEHPS